MPEYVDKEKAIDLFYSIDPENDGSDGCTTALVSDDYTSEEIEEMLSLLPVADVAPVVHGRWDDSTDGITPFCTACGCTHRCLIRRPPYCPNCGAKMDLEESQ